MWMNLTINKRKNNKDMKPEHLALTSKSNTQLDLEALYKIAPSCFTETRDEKTGELRHVVDFHKLRQLLGDNTVEGELEAYEFTWVGKQAARREAATPINKTLRPVPESSVDWDSTQNIYIEGDNLDALKLLQKSYLGKVKMIYIDPPYNTGNDFVYHDDFHRTQAEEDLEAGNVDELGNRFVKNTETNGKFHSDWCSMIYPRLQMAHTLLTNDGAIFVSIDDHEYRNLKYICDEIFGESNFIACIVWQRTYAPISLKKFFSESHEYCLVYAKDIQSFKMNLLPRTNKQNKDYKNPDKDPRGPWKVGNLTVGPAVEKQVYEIIGPTGKRFLPPSGYCWRFTKEKFQAMVEDNRIWFGENGNNAPVPKLFLSEVQNGVTPMTLWTFDEVGHGQEATRELRELMGESVFTNPKPLRYMKRLLQIGTDKDSLILDFFSGSATTAHATMQLNSEDGGTRKFILVQLPDELDKGSVAYKAGYKNICEIGEERIRRAGKKIKEELQGAALVAVRNGKSSQGDLFDQGNQQADGHKGRTLQADDLDTGFRVFRIDSSNMKDVYFAPKDLKPQQLELFADNVKEDRTELDLLYGCMLDWGVQLSMPMSKEEVDGCTVYTVNEGDLVACFSKHVTDNVIKAMADKSPLRVLFRDSCFNKDDQKINIFEQFKQLLGWSDDEALKNIKVI
jgi:adenine-specific DNA-methyltransferase